MPYVYILECSDGSLYTGWTTDIERRLNEHNNGHGAKYTRGRRPVRLAYSEEYTTVTEAMRREKKIQRMRRRDKLVLIGKRYSGVDKNKEEKMNKGSQTYHKEYSFEE